MSATDAPTLPNDETVPNDWRRLREQPWLGPDTGATLDSLEVLREIEALQARQAVATDTAELPPYLGPFTGDQLGLLGTGERGSLEVAEREMAPRGRGAHHRRRPFRAPSCWPLLAVLVVQAALSLRLVWSNTAFADEALYLWAGHLEWSHWLHGTPLPTFPTYFSGAPVLYPPIGALADSLGGLPGARLLSLALMLCATAMLHGTARRLYGRLAADYAAGLFGTLAATQFLGVFATYDAMALTLLALAAWLSVRAAERSAGARSALIAAAALAMATADAVKYASALFDPVIIGVAVLATWRVGGRRAGMAVGALLAAALALAAGGALAAAGRQYWQGIAFTTLSRTHGDYPAPGILYVSAMWAGGVMLLAIIGAAAVASRRGGRAETALGCALAAAIFLAPANQARIHVFTSLFKHVGYGAWFGAIVAGVALAAFGEAVPEVKRRVARRMAAAAVALCAVPGTALAAGHFDGWADTSRLTSAVAPLLESTAGPVYASDANNVLEYYLGGELGARPIVSPWFYSVIDPATGTRVRGAAAYAVLVRERYMSVIVLDFGITAATDDAIYKAIGEYGGYRRAVLIPYFAGGKPGRFLVYVRDTAPMMGGAA